MSIWKISGSWKKFKPVTGRYRSITLFYQSISSYSYGAVNYYRINMASWWQSVSNVCIPLWITGIRRKYPNILQLVYRIVRNWSPFQCFERDSITLCTCDHGELQQMKHMYCILKHECWQKCKCFTILVYEMHPISNSRLLTSLKISKWKLTIRMITTMSNASNPHLTMQRLRMRTHHLDPEAV